MTTRLARRPHRFSAQRARAHPRAAGGILKKLLIALAILVFLLALFIALLPTIASSFAPGIIESAAADSIKGSVKVEKVSLGWGGPTVIGPLELRDEAGKPVGRVRLEVPVGMWGAIGLATGDLSHIDIGEVKVDGRLDVVRNADGTMNLTKAIEPKNPAAAPAPGSSSGSGSTSSSPIDKIKAKVTVTDLDVTYKDLSAPAGSPTSAIGVDNFAGSADIDYAAKAGTADVTSAFTGKVQSGAAVGTAGGDDLKINALVKASGLPTAGTFGPLNPNVNADIAVTGVPVTLVDALAGFGGELAASIGAKADTTIKVNGTRDNATANLNLTAPGAGADLNLAYDGAAITATRPGKIWAKSTQFIAGMQAAKAPLADIARSVRLDQAPGIEISLDALRIPLPKSAMDKPDPKTLDLRGTQAKLTIKTDAIVGRVALEPPVAAAASEDDTAAPAAPAPAAPASVAAMKPFKVDPTTVQVVIDDLAKGATITSASKATIDGQSAGDLFVAITAGGLLDSSGRLKALNGGGGQPIPDALDADIRLKGLATALVNPVLTGLKLPVDLREDVGPTLDLAVAAKTTGPAPQPASGAPATGLAAMPPMDVSASVTSTNIKLDAPVRIANGQITTAGGGKPIDLTIAKAGPIARRILAEQAKSAPAGSKPMKLAGDVRVRATIKDFAAPLDASKLDPAKLKGVAEITLEDAALTLPVAAPAAVAKGAAPAPAAPKQSPIVTQKLTTRITLGGEGGGGSSGPKAVINGTMSHAGTPFTLDADFSAPGFNEQFLKGKNASLADLLAYRPTGTLAFKSVPASLTSLAPGLHAMLSATPIPGDVKSQVFALANALVGKSVDLTASLTPKSATENAVTATVRTAGSTGAPANPPTPDDRGPLSADLALTLKPTEVAVTQVFAKANILPRQLDGILDAVMPPPATAAAPGQPAPPTQPAGPPLRLRDPVTINASVDPLTVPIKPNTFEPDFSKLERVIARVNSPGTLVVDNFAIGTKPDGATKRETVGVRGLKASVDAPGSLLSGDKAAQIALSADAELIRGKDAQTLSTLKVKANAAQDLTKPITANITLGKVNFAQVDSLIGKGDGLYPGLIGNTGDVWITAKGVPDPKNPDIRLEVATETERVKFVTIKLDAKQGALRLAEPVTIAVRPDVATLNRVAFPPRPDGSAGPSLDGLATIEVKLNKFAAAIPNAEKKTGPLKPDVFALDAGITIDSVRVNTPVAGAAGAPATMIPVALEGVRLDAKSAGAGVVNLDAIVDKVTGSGASSTDKASVKATVASLADASGNLTTDKAVIDAQVDVRGFPSALIDALANQKGLLAEALGPRAHLTATATKLSAGGAGGGSLTAKANSSRAEATLAGAISDKTFVATAPLNVTLVEITPQLVKQLAGAIPLVSEAEKTKKDEPATVKGENLRVPLDGNLRKLNGRIAVDPGVLRYSTAGFFQKILKMGELKDAGSVGKRIEPFVVNIKDGVASYDRFKLPIGEFKFETSGTVDLVTRQIDIITYVPFFAVTDEISGALNTGLGSLLGDILPGAIDRATMIPIRTKGPMDNPKVEPDIALFAKENAQNLLKAPGKILEGGIGKELEKIIPGGIPGLPKKDGGKPPR